MPHQNPPLQRFQNGMRTALLTIIINMFLAVIKIVTGIVGTSYALIADGIESVMDIFSSTVVWSGFKISAIPADRNHPFGHGRAETLAGMVVSISLLAAGVVVAIQSIREILTPHHGPHPATLIVLVLVIITKETLSRFLFKMGKNFDSTAMICDAWHSRSDALTSLAAFIGITIAIIGGEDFHGADDWAALFASGIILFNGVKLLKVSTAEIMDEAVDPVIESRVRQIASSVGRVQQVEKCRIRKSGYGFFVDLHLEVNGHMTVIEGHDIAHKVKDALINSEIKIIDATIHVEPSHGNYSS